MRATAGPSAGRAAPQREGGAVPQGDLDGLHGPTLPRPRYAAVSGGRRGDCMPGAGCGGCRPAPASYPRRVLLEAIGSGARRVRGLPPRDPRQAKYVTGASLRWMWRNRAFRPWYLLRFWRLFWLRVLHPDVVTEGMVFIGRRVELYARTGYARLILGRWVHVGAENRLRAHEGTLRVGDKAVFGRDNTINCYLDVEIGAATIMADWVYVCDFDHVYDDIHLPIKDQGIVKSPVRIGPDCWIGTKVTVLRGTTIGHGLRPRRPRRGARRRAADVGRRRGPRPGAQGPRRGLRGQGRHACGARGHRAQDGARRRLVAAVAAPRGLR